VEAHVHNGVQDDDVLDIETWERIARRWGLTPAQLPQAVQYLKMELLASCGQLQRVEIQYRPDGERHVYRSTAANERGEVICIDRPRGWDRRNELAAMGDLCTVIEHPP
jgi:hypothetical protein